MVIFDMGIWKKKFVVRTRASRQNKDGSFKPSMMSRSKLCTVSSLGGAKVVKASS